MTELQKVFYWQSLLAKIAASFRLPAEKDRFF
jgi:hypothetical protein